ncbi:MAG: DNA-binding protein [Thermoprotei archaeon]|nr:MAG: DNA-binding protein [Thermoprotei archaeon]
MDPREEVLYRFNLAIEQLETAIKRFSIEDWAGVVQASQIVAENAVKAIIAHFHLPSWTHDSSGELRIMSSEIPDRFREDIDELIEIVSTLAPEHGRTSYGIPSERLTPRRLYDRNKAEKALNMARKAVAISQKILKHIGYTL